MRRMQAFWSWALWETCYNHHRPLNQAPRKNYFCYRHKSQRKFLVHEVEQVKLRLLQVNFVFIIFYFLSTISFSLQLHLKKPWVRGKSLRGFSLAAMTALLMSCSPSGPRCCPSSTTCWTSRQWGRKRSPTYLQYQSGKIQWKMWGRGNRFHSSGCGQIWWMAQGLIGDFPKLGRDTEKEEEEIMR